MKSATVVTGYFGDPRTNLDEDTLAKASRNSFPIAGSHKQRRDRSGLTVGAVCALLLGAVTFWSMSSHRQAPHTEAAASAPRRLVPATQVLNVAVKPASFSVPAPPPAHVEEAQPGLAAPSLIVDLAIPTAIDSSGAARPDGKRGIGMATGLGALPNNGLGIASATPMGDPANTVAEGTLIPAVLETAINSDLPGFSRAVVSEDILSFDRTQVLIPRGSHLIGQYKDSLATGQRRAYVMWQRLIRSDGVSIDLGSSPATDFAGNSGLVGNVDTHFFARFGSAILLSVIDAFSAVGSASVVISGSQSASAIAFQHDGQIPPTVTVPQGTPIRIFTARDLDFSAASTRAQK